MRSIDYELEIIGEKKIYKPLKDVIDPIVNSQSKIFEITAENGYGKTFILNLLAYALEADKLPDSKILKSIKESVLRYDDNTSYGLDYKIKLELPDNNTLSLSKEKGEGKLIQINDGAPTGHIGLHKDLTIIYDVPSNPSERLNDIIKDLGGWNKKLKNKFVQLAKYFQSITKEFNSVRNDDKIKKLENRSTELGAEIETEKILLLEKNKLFNDIKNISNLKEISSLFRKKDLMEKDLFKKKRELEKHPKPQKIEKKDLIKIDALNKELIEYERRFKDINTELVSQISSDDEILSLITENKRTNEKYEAIKKEKLKDIVNDDDYITRREDYIKNVSSIQDIILSFIQDKKNGKSYKIHNSYSQFIDLLEELMENKIDYFLKDAIDIDSKKLKKSLETIIQNHKVKNYNSLKMFLNNELKTLNGIIGQYFKTNINLEKENKKKLVNNDDSKYYKLKNELTKHNEIFIKTKNSLDFKITDCAKSLGHKDKSEFNSLEKLQNLIITLKNQILNKSLLDDLNESMSSLEKELRDGEGIIGNLISDKKLNDTTLSIENSKVKSKYNDEQKEKINEFQKTLLFINNNLLQYEDVISNYEQGNLNGEIDYEFIQLAGKIIAYSMDYKLLRPDGEFVKLEFYDLQAQEFHCEENIVIKKDDVSTGLASANYLKQRIDNVEGKYVVVLLDEIGNMAQNAVNIVIESIKKLEKQDRLVLAVFTRPNSEGIEIKNY